MATQQELLDEKQAKLEDSVVQNIDKGQQLYEIYKGRVLDRVAGNKRDQESLSLGHLHSKSIVIINAVIYVQRALNKVSSMPHDFVPVMKKTPAGIVRVVNDIEALELGEKYGFEIVVKTTIGLIKLAQLALARKDNPKMEIITQIDKNGHKGPDYFYFYKGRQADSTILEQFAYDVVRTSSSFKGSTSEQTLASLSNIPPSAIFPGMQSMRPTPELYGASNYKDKDAD